MACKPCVSIRLGEWFFRTVSPSSFRGSGGGVNCLPQATFAQTIKSPEFASQSADKHIERPRVSFHRFGLGLHSMLIQRIPIFVLAIACAFSVHGQQAIQNRQKDLQSQFDQVSERSPKFVRVSNAAPNVLAVEIQEGVFQQGGLVAYQSKQGDRRKVETSKNGDETITLIRDGRPVGYLVGDDREWLVKHEFVVGDPLRTFLAGASTTSCVQSNTDSNFETPIKPDRVFRKSRVNHWALGTNEKAILHTVYLEMPFPVLTDNQYTINLGELNVAPRTIDYTCDVTRVRSDTVHAHQIGFRPDDPHKQAFISCWLGTGGEMALPEPMRFAVVDESSGKPVFQGRSETTFPASQVERMAREANFNGTDVAVLDFSNLRSPGKYRIVVEGIGCSYPFEIGEQVWSHAFQTQMRGFFHNRTGMELKPPTSDFMKPRDMHPEDGYPTFFTKYRAIEDGIEAWEKIVAQSTGQPAPNAWGGYHDAGDWNPRRVTHMESTYAMLEIFEMFPDHFASMRLNIPNNGPLPDILEEANWEVACFRRLQYENGGVGFGIESKGDPLPGEVSWLNSFASYVFAPDYQSSWYYAAVVARMARVVRPFDPNLADDYLMSAKSAFAFAESDYAKDEANNAIQSHKDVWRAIDYRNLAALELYRTTEDESYHNVFLQDTVLNQSNPNLFQWQVHVQRYHAFAYTQLPDHLGEKTMKKNAQDGIVKLAEMALRYGSENAFGITTCDRFRPQFLALYSTPDACDLTRAHFLTGESKYLSGAIRATQFQAGCNPNNWVYMTGLGANPLKHVFKLDSRHTAQATPAGLVPYGNIDFQKWNDNGTTWPIKWHLGEPTVPNVYAWPVSEAYFDLGRWPMLEEFTVDKWASNIWVWGYLSARPEVR